ncbi:unnamed protein product [Gulo gulo]|uniref:Secreted protein n=1 Tax=Gulo gulo TaxID=48420 RepID=A0A9X9LEX7_GULGU|nr:unnamed protein product [Gulo gulo]
MFFCFFLCLDSSLRASIIRSEAEGTTSIWTCQFQKASSLSSTDPSHHWLPWQYHHQAFLETDPARPSLGPRQT